MIDNLRLSIKKPCSKQFNEFKQTKSGGFCNSCKKEVVDFRSMTDNQVFEYFKVNEENTCGYFNEFQLKDYAAPVGYSEKQRFNIVGVLGFAVLSLLSLNTINAQSNSETKIRTVQIAKEESKTVIQDSIKKDKIIKGTVLDESGNPLPGVNILIKGTSKGVQTDFDGNFQLLNAEKGDVLLFSYIGFKSQQIKIENHRWHINVALLEDLIAMGAIEVNKTYKSKRSLWQKVKSIF